MATVLVTGAAGFIGSNSVRYWRGEHPGDRVVAPDALTCAGVRSNVDELAGVEFVHGSIGNVELVEHLRWHHISTCEVYGDLFLNLDEAFGEESPYRPRTPYNAAKAGGDPVVRASGLTYDLPVTITNCANNHGPFQFPGKVAPLFTTRALAGEAFPLYASTTNRREWSHVDDHARAIDAVLHHGRVGETYNVGSGAEVDIEGVADTVLGALGLGPEYRTIVPDRPSHDRRYLLDSSKLRGELGWAPRVGRSPVVEGADNSWGRS